jgi:hypothetical protein
MLQQLLLDSDTVLADEGAEGTRYTGVLEGSIAEQMPGWMSMDIRVLPHGTSKVACEHCLCNKDHGKRAKHSVAVVHPVLHFCSTVAAAGLAENAAFIASTTLNDGSKPIQAPALAGSV